MLSPFVAQPFVVFRQTLFIRLGGLRNGNYDVTTRAMYLLPAHPFMDAGNVITFRALEANGHTLLFVDHSDVDHLISLKGLRKRLL